jgi:F0F1-type ATP synthase membrane subunit b/b'
MNDFLNAINQPVAFWQAIAMCVVAIVSLDFLRGVRRAALDGRQRRIHTRKRV